MQDESENIFVISLWEMSDEKMSLKISRGYLFNWQICYVVYKYRTIYTSFCLCLLGFPYCMDLISKKSKEIISKSLRQKMSRDLLKSYCRHVRMTPENGSREGLNIDKRQGRDPGHPT
jgi:hypothetical protein